MNFSHKSVLLQECIDYLNIKSDGVYVDGTLGGGGHSIEIVKKLNKYGLLIGIDQDQNAINAAKQRLRDYLNCTRFIQNNFSRLEQVLKEIEINKIDGILLDLGVSSHQLDEAERGFSYMQDAPLDMRMDRGRDLNAKYIVNNYSLKQLGDIIKDYGEERWAKRIAEFIIEARKKKEIESTFELVDIIKAAIPKGARIEGPHPAKRTFQAIRIEVNQELDIIDQTIEQACKYMNIGGRICIITFHSLEDRIVKNTFKRLSNPCICPPKFPICKCNKEPCLKIISRKPIIPSLGELEENPRARSAKLRVAEKILSRANE